MRSDFAAVALVVLLALTSTAYGWSTSHRKLADVLAARREAQETPDTVPWNWWSSMAVAGAYCSLRDFPGLPYGEGPSTIICKQGQAYDHQFAFRLVPITQTNLSSNLPLDTSTSYHLRVFSTMFSYTGFGNQGSAKNVLRAGLAKSAAAVFTLVKSSGKIVANQTINPGTESVYLRTRAGKFCQVRGAGISSFIYCDLATASAGATLFTFRASSLYSVSLQSRLPAAGGAACGAHFLQISGGSAHTVNCTVPDMYKSNYITSLALAFRTPGAYALASGSAVTFKHYDTLYHYHMSSWVANTTVSLGVTFEELQSLSAKQWFVLSKETGTAGQALKDGDVVTLKSTYLNNFCGITSASGQMMCNKPNLNTADTGYRYTLRINANL